MAPDPEPAKRRAGRPKDTSIDVRAREATRELLVEEGFAATTVQAIAERAGAHTSALYRRWPSRLELIEDAVFADQPITTIRPTGDLRKDLRRFVRAYLAVFASPAAQAAIPGLLAMHGSDGRTRGPGAWDRLSLRPAFRAILAAAPPGELDPDLDPDEAFDLVLGAVLVRVIVPLDVRRPPSVHRTVDLLLRVLRPPGL